MRILVFTRLACLALLASSCRVLGPCPCPTGPAQPGLLQLQLQPDTWPLLWWHWALLGLVLGALATMSPLLRALRKEGALLREIGRRLSSPKPTFWKRLQGRAVATAGSIGGLLASGYVPEPWLPYFKGAGLFFLGLAAAAQLPSIDGSETLPPTDSPAL
jgi:hypothetical protein